MALVLIPQSLAYAELAGLPPYHGLYAAMLPPIAAAFFASSPYLQTGPVAMTSLLTFGALAPLATPASGDFVALAALLAIVVGLARLVLGMMRVGWVAYLMSHPVLTGFTSAAAILVIASQLPTALGVSPADGSVLGGAWWTVVHPGAWDGASVILSALTVALVLGGRRVHALLPGVLVAVVIGVVFSLLTDYGGPTLGAVPTGLPPFSIGHSWQAVPQLLLPGLVIALVGFAEAAAISSTFAAQDRAPWNPSREFVSQGMANLASGISGGFPVGGSFSRSSVARMAGGTSRWTGAIAGLLVLAFLPIAGVISVLPLAILGAIVIAAVVKLVALRPLLRLFGHSYPQAIIAWSTFALTLALAPRIDRAILVGVGLAVAVHLWRELPLRVHTDFRDGVLRIEPEGVLFFGSSPGLHEALLKELAAHNTADRLVIDLRRLGRIDYTGALALKGVVDDAQQAQLEVAFLGVPQHARRILGRVFGDSPLGEDKPPEIERRV